MVTIRGNGTDLGRTVVIVESSKTLATGAYRLVPRSAGRMPVDAQVFTVDEQNYLAVLIDGLGAADEVVYDLSRPDRQDNDAIAIVPGAGTLNARIERFGDLWVGYRAQGEPKPYLFPVLGPKGAKLTRAYPMEAVKGEDQDHPHQRSFWFTHGKVNGVDFWSEEKGHGTIRETAKSFAGGPVLGVLRTTNEWLAPDGKKVCDDERVWRFCPSTSRERIIDFDVTVKATVGSVTFGDTKEGAFGVRVASSMDVKRHGGGRITNAEGLNDLAAWGKPSAWVDYTGPVAGETMGIAILNHPTSFRFPTTWHVRDYGLFAANPFGWHDFGRAESGEHTIPPGGTMTMRYRVILHQGATAEARIPQAFTTYAKPPTIRVE
jgi:hypothetical protein